jgi:very-short-patch-repair endonuclease
MKRTELTNWAGQRAREPRQSMTSEELALWARLRDKRCAGLRFRRQAPIGRYIADFVCFRIRLVVELDGSHHGSNREHDALRDAWFESQGFRVMRFWNQEWNQDPEGVLRRIEEASREAACLSRAHTPTPPP